MTFSLSDTISKEDIDYLQAGEFKFATSVAPNERKSFWQELAGPALVLGTAIITVFLLFTVRSK